MSAGIIIAFTFGTIFLATLLAVAIFVRDPTPLLVTVIKIIVALAAAGVAAMIPGFIDVQLSSGASLAISAGGAIAVLRHQHAHRGRSGGPVRRRRVSRQQGVGAQSGVTPGATAIISKKRAGRR